MATPPEPPGRRPRRSRAAALPLHALPPLVLAGGLLLTGLVTLGMARAAVAEQRRLEQDLLLRAGGAIRAALAEDIQLLQAVAGLVRVAAPVGEAEFLSFAAAIGGEDRVLGFARRLEPDGPAGSAEDSAEDSAELRSRLELIAPPGHGQRPRLGEDPAAEPGHREAMERSARTGLASLSGGPEPMLLVLAVPASAAGGPPQGWTLTPVDSAALITRAVARLGEGEWLAAHLRLTGGRAGRPAPPEPGGSTISQPLDLAGRTWTLSLERAALGKGPGGLQPGLWMPLAAGLTASALAALSARALVNSHLAMGAALAVSRAAGEERALASTVFEASRLGIVVSDPEGRILMVNEAFSRLSGYRPVEVLGRHTNLLRSGRHDDSFYRDLWNCLLSQGHWQGDLWNRVRSGELRRHHLSISTVRSADQQPRYFVGMLEDITDRYAEEKATRHQARHDVLTGLGNRALLMEQLERDLALAERHHWAVAVLYLDLDGFKEVNDRHGHAVGDRVLQVMARRLQAVLRGSDLICRQGGDEFVVLVPHAGGEGELLQIAGKLIEVCEEPLTEAGLELRLSASVGIARYPEHARTVRQLLVAADRAMYAAKAQGACVRMASLLPL
ncbi:MAG: diguanylate cyclase [Prochlorococcaceae cyanobacterium]